MRTGMEWVKQFYSKQHEWAGVYDGGVTETHRKNAAIVQRLAGGKIGRLLELGAGGGQNTAAAADLGYSVIAIELVELGPSLRVRTPSECEPRTCLESFTLVLPNQLTSTRPSGQSTEDAGLDALRMRSHGLTVRTEH